jgi:hypothetical protein
MSLRWVAVAIGIVGLGIVAYGMVMRLQQPPRILSVGTIEVADPASKTGAKRRLLTRVLMAGGVQLTEVELPNGTWIDCSADCADAARKATVDFWDDQQKRRR